MRIFGPIYDRCLRWAAHHRAPGYLAAMSAAESVVFPVPPDVMLAPMTLAQPKRWWRLALICTIASVVGGLLGYALGSYALDAVWPWIERLSWSQRFFQVQALFERYGFWIVFVAGFTPIPYKVFTLASGAAGMGLLPFVLGSLIGRGGRFFLVAGLVAFGGEPLERLIRRYVEWLGWAVAVLVIAGLIWWELRG
ncbi:YqaA family protein [Rehaibacterium terrae]|jgi:membrane protein YqaA with SNARE-associated domain|uniref:Membrane protein YqaA with SNARE-associated domain n=1 Tax=Rehaibacterium terrae TaxID=1341696 RepID=A0A7W7Y059_9GAMM|nr:YqaA family protein [Rehaibacterium terrae]MBB5015650.1 membrane protein YqaA with SNARE-associated domain [Rehaibacterium terrae]